MTTTQERTMAGGKIERLAAEDFADIAETCEAIMRVSGTFEQSGTACIVDGSMYSPSTRALAGGTHAYYIEDAGESQQRYTDELDRLCDEWSADHDASLYWEDGCLWLSRDAD